MAAERVEHPRAEATVAVVRQGQGGTGKEAQAAPQCRPLWMQWAYTGGFANPCNLGHVLPVFGTVHECAQVYLIKGREELEEVIRANLVALIGWIRNPMRQEQEWPHVLNPSYGKSRAPMSWQGVGADASRR